METTETEIMVMETTQMMEAEYQIGLISLTINSTSNPKNYMTQIASSFRFW